MIKNNQVIDIDYYIPPSLSFDFLEDPIGIIDVERTIANLVYDFAERDFMQQYIKKQEIKPLQWVYREPNTFFTAVAYVEYLQSKKVYNDKMFEYYQQKNRVQEAAKLVHTVWPWYLLTEGIDIIEDEVLDQVDLEETEDDLNFA